MLTAYIITLLSMSLITTLVYSYDKMQALQIEINNLTHKHIFLLRIPEIVLITLSAMGGVYGTILSMIFLNHKSNMSRKWYFFFLIILSFIIQTALLLLLIFKW